MMISFQKLVNHSKATSLSSCNVANFIFVHEALSSRLCALCLCSSLIKQQRWNVVCSPECCCWEIITFFTWKDAHIIIIIMITPTTTTVANTSVKILDLSSLLTFLNLKPFPSHLLQILFEFCMQKCYATISLERNRNAAYLRSCWCTKKNETYVNTRHITQERQRHNKTMWLCDYANYHAYFFLFLSPLVVVVLMKEDYLVRRMATDTQGNKSGYEMHTAFCCSVL